MSTAAIADRKARDFLRSADPVLARVIDAHPDFRPRVWIDELPGLDAFGTLIFQVAGQQLSVRATRTMQSSTSSARFSLVQTLISTLGRNAELYSLPA